MVGSGLTEISLDHYFLGFLSSICIDSEQSSMLALLTGEKLVVVADLGMVYNECDQVGGLMISAVLASRNVTIRRHSQVIEVASPGDRAYWPFTWSTFGMICRCRTADQSNQRSRRCQYPGMLCYTGIAVFRNDVPERAFDLNLDLAEC